MLTEGGAEVIIELKLDYDRVKDDMPEKLYDVKIAIVEKIVPRRKQILI